MICIIDSEDHFLMMEKQVNRKQYWSRDAALRRSALLSQKIFKNQRIYSSRSNFASFLSTQIVANGKSEDSNAKTKSSSSHLNIFLAGKQSSR